MRAAASFSEDVLDEDGNIRTAFAQRRHGDLDHAKPVEQILAEVTCGNTLGQVAIRRGDDTDVDATGARVADRLNLPALEKTQQRRLHPQAHLTDFVEEQRSTVGDLQLADAIAIRAGEAALDVPEQLRFEQRFGDASTVHRDEVAAGPSRRRVDFAGHDVFTNTALACDQRLGVRSASALRKLADAKHLFARGDQYVPTHGRRWKRTACLQS